MKILHIIDAVLPDPRLGEAERVVWYLSKELNRLGHEVSILARNGSQCAFAQIIARDAARSVESQIPQGTEIVHLHLVGGQPPQIATVPYIITQYHTSPELTDNTRTIYLSQDHAGRNGSTHFVYSGLDWAEFGRISLAAPRRYYHSVSRSSAELQGTMQMIRSIKGAKLKVLGRSRLSCFRDARIALSRRVHFTSSLSDDSRSALMLSSKGLICGTPQAVPFGLEIIESLFFGAPVFGAPVGSLPEIVGREFGALSSDPQQIIRSMREAEYTPYRCHQYAMDCFNSQIMTLQYLKKYDVILTNNSLCWR